MNEQFYFVNLASPNAKMFDGMTHGRFTDFHGRAINIRPADLAVIVEKTRIAIESTRTESGEIVGLPIDQDGHDHKGGAGWIVGVELSEDKKTIRFIPKWTQIGIELISQNIRRFFSVSVDLMNKVVIGGSLTNWPATRDATSGQLLLRPIELSQGIFTFEKENQSMAELSKDGRAKKISAIKKFKEDNPDSDISIDGIEEMSDADLMALYEKCKGKGKREMSLLVKGLDSIVKTLSEFTERFKDTGDEDESGEDEEEKSPKELQIKKENKKMTVPNTAVNPQIRELLKSPEVAIELGRMAEERAQETIKADQRRAHVVEFASTLVGGTAKQPVGLPVPASEVVEILLSLPEAQSNAVELLLTKTLHAALSLKESGLEGEIMFGRQRLPAEYVGSLQTWLDAGKSIETFFKENTELGKMSDYNLTEFIVKGE